MRVDVVYRGSSLALEADSVEELTARFIEAVPRAAAPRFLLRGAQLHAGPLPAPHAGVAALRVMVVSATLDETAAIQAARPACLRDDLDSAVPSRHNASASRPIRRRNNSSATFGFDEIEVLPGFSDGDAVRAILERLADDPGVVAVMKARRWRVPVLGEMYPEGKVGTDPVCVLGYNVNRGQRINLRVRTDGAEGCRSGEPVAKSSTTAPLPFAPRLQTSRASASTRLSRTSSGTSSRTTRSASTRPSSTRS